MAETLSVKQSKTTVSEDSKKVGGSSREPVNIFLRNTIENAIQEDNCEIQLRNTVKKYS